jgi:hypothetical protein
MKCFLKLFFISLLLLLFGCCGLKKTKTETIIITKVDTIIRVVKDTVLKTVSVPFYDTAIIENTTSIARSFYNVKTEKIELQLKGKPFDIPVQLQKISYVKQIVKEKTGIAGMFWYLIIFLITFFITIIIIKKYE